MKIGPELAKVLAKTYEPSALIEMTWQRYDLAIKTDDAGRPILLFIGDKDEQGKIKGERFARRLAPGKDHWDNKGRATAQF